MSPAACTRVARRGTEVRRLHARRHAPRDREHAQVYPYPDGQRYQFIAQLFHSAAIGAHLSLATGGTMVLKDHFALEDYMHTLVSERIESISVVPDGAQVDPRRDGQRGL